MELKPGKILISEREITDRVESLANEINASYGGRPVTIVGVLDGCIVFLVDLVKRLTMPLEIVLVRVETYGGATRPQKEPLITDSLARVAGRNVLIVDDIYDTGKTLAAVAQAVKAAGAREARTCLLLEKKRQHDRQVAMDFLGFTVSDEFVVGYGLDYAGKYRNLPYVAALEGFDEGPTIA
jgi:hypoxanthine phosphoribosyltransferase